jgi:hypothetical protein
MPHRPTLKFLKTITTAALSICLALLSPAAAAARDCGDLGRGVLKSVTGVEIPVDGGAGCSGGLASYSYGLFSDGGIKVPGVGTLSMPSIAGLPAGELALFRYDIDIFSGDTVYSLSFVDQNFGYAVDMTFRSKSASQFTMHEMIVYAGPERDRLNIVYREHATAWFFESISSSTIDIGGTFWIDENDDGVFNAGEQSLVDNNFNVVAFRCGNQDGLVSRNTFSQELGAYRYRGLPHGSYQLKFVLFPVFSPTHKFARPEFDADGNLKSFVRFVESHGVSAWSDCLLFSNTRIDIDVGLRLIE